MKMMVNYIRPEKLDAVLDAIGSSKVAVSSICYCSVRGYGRQKGHLNAYKIEGPAIAFLPKTRLTMIINDSDVEKMTDAISESSRTGRIGDGKILVVPISG